MKKQKHQHILSCFLAVFMLLSIISNPRLSAEDNAEEWYPFYFENELDENSPLNIGKLVLDAPAGKHGFVKAVGDHFEFEDGTPARFWGTNLSMSACFPSKKDAVSIADRLAFFGFNAVRLHHMDFAFEPIGIFKDTSPAYKNKQLKDTQTLSEKQLDRLDYLIYQLKKRGIYVNINLLVSRHFTEADGVPDAKTLGRGAKAVSLFDPKLIELQKKYALDLLTHYNPYTKLKYNKDPVITFVEITNENSLMHYWMQDRLNSDTGPWKNKLSDYYLEALDQLWNSWLEKKHGSVRNIKAVWENPVLPTSPPSSTENILHSDWIAEKHRGAEAKISSSDNTFFINNIKTTKTTWHLQFKNTNFPLVKDQIYKISFWAKSEKNRPLTLIIMKNDAPYDNLGLTKKITLEPDWNDFTFYFRATETYAKSRATFILDNNTTPLFIKDIVLAPTQPLGLQPEERQSSQFTFTRPTYSNLPFYTSQRAKDIKEFYKATQKQCLTDMRSFLKNHCRIKIPITGIGGIRANEDITTLTETDYIDIHGYWDHPSFPNKKWDIQNFRVHNKSISTSPKLGLISAFTEHQSAIKKLLTSNAKPITISEWNHCYPNQYAYETPVLLAHFARKNNWAALFQFDFTHRKNSRLDEKKIKSFFDIYANTQQLILNSVASLIYHKHSETAELEIDTSFYNYVRPGMRILCGNMNGKKIHFKHLVIQTSGIGILGVIDIDENRTILFALSKIRNKDSRWVDNLYSWGNPPAQLEKMSITIKGETDAFSIYPIDRKGKKTKPVRQSGTITIDTNEYQTPVYLLEKSK
ncbi:MAG: carbohydrate binding domain-containing protein [Candidatus Omnitrophica bacterium]|nr:carbohydrate binding domain-containing protein [Candidatus Omnitrophota bacterium]